LGSSGAYGYIDTISPASSTNPTLGPANNNKETGMGLADTNQLSLIAGGIEGIRITNESISHVFGDLNVTGTIYGDGSQLTNLNVSNINLSGYVPYTGADKNVDLGVNNFSVNTNTLFVDSNTGKVGIGTNVLSSAPLTIDPNGLSAIYINEAQPIRWAGGSYIGLYSGLMSLYSGGYDMTFRGYNGTNVLDILYMDKDGVTGKIGIGTTTPQNTLNVIGDGNFTGNITSQIDFCIEGGDCLSNVVSSSGNVSGFGIDNYVPLWDGTGNLDNSVIYQNGSNLGIGTTVPTDKLSISEGRINIRETTASDYAVLEFGNDQSALRGGFFLAGSTATGYGGANSLNLIGFGTGDLALGTAGVVDMTIENGGNVGIGNVDPTEKLEVTGSAKVTGSMIIGETNITTETNGDVQIW
jgi:hypothetical protein